MSRTKKKKAALFSGMSVMKKFVFLDFLLLLAIAAVSAVLVATVMSVTAKKYKQIEKTVVSSTEQMTTLGIESAVSIAKNIYTNEPVYDFLNRKYNSSSDYFEAYYPLQQNTALSTADTNIVKKCTIYTSTPTIVTGGTMRMLSEATDEEWYKDIKKYNKPTILSIDSDDHQMMLVRRLDYTALDTGESYLVLILNNAFIEDFANALDFDGQFYVMSGSDLIYSSDENVKSVSDVAITPEFQCITHNYYSVDIDFYSYSNRSGFIAFMRENLLLIPCLAAVLIIALLSGLIMAKGIIRRIKPIITEFGETGSIKDLKKGSSGTDEIGKLLDICADMSERLALKGDEFIESSNSLLQKSSDYNSLFATAMRLDAELTAANKMPCLKADTDEEEIPLADETELVKKTAEKHGAEYSCKGVSNENWMIPAYSLTLIADDFFSNFSGESAAVSVSDEAAEITFTSSVIPRSSETLKLHAIFEDANVSSEYSFDRSNRFNPYIRIRHCLGSRVDMIINEKDNFTVTFRIKKAPVKQQ
ncbi:MAG: hypothetical protein IJ779_03805 [Ruminococcus sp.]|nr:hypothetical protein [Ruminococcus sp.]